MKQLPELSPKLNALILRMLAKKPEERPQTMEQVMTTLRDCARALGIDVEGQLLPLVPVERPTALLGAALAGVAPKPTASAAPSPAPLPRLAMPAPVLAPPVAPPLSAAPAPVAPSPAPEAAPQRPARAVARTQVAPELGSSAAVSATPAAGPAVAPPGARAFPRTLIAGVAELKAVAEGRLPEAPGGAPSEAPREAPISAFVGGTMVLQPERPPEPARPAPTGGKIRPQVGGTRIMEHAEPPGDEPGEAEEDDAEGADEPPVARAGGEHTMRVPVGDEGLVARLLPIITGRAGLVALGAVAVVALAIVMVRLLGGGTPAAGRKTKPVEAPVAIEPPAQPAPPPEPPAAPAVEPARPATVSIDIQGLSADTTVLVDDQPVTLPTRVPRGPELHRFTLRPPRGPERTIEIDGSRDRVVELVMAPEGTKAPHPPAPRPVRPPAHPSPRPGALPAPAPRPRAGAASDRKAITDL